MTTSPETDIATANFAVPVKTVEEREAATVEALYDEHAAALWRYARRLTGDEARAPAAPHARRRAGLGVRVLGAHRGPAIGAPAEHTVEAIGLGVEAGGRGLELGEGGVQTCELVRELEYPPDRVGQEDVALVL